ncbi:uncharacterized protein UV8b_08156 [Ustilaginoidea virens]|uniref:C3H1-type domain-containing protein n=1 Tax=Ustilaginoidea virens TaxID=1159556 RepID=A0A8E5HYC7_USTVR|nr:uncharacterized protein UV8b_08156 [Ustilaginoidea virens]QUC23915.1 hypothetical protein UV8b_08156 [Ustilaginoidea virens]
MAVASNLGDFVQRFRDIQQQRDASDPAGSGRPDVLRQARVGPFRHQSQKLADELQDCKRENRNLQTRLSDSEARADRYARQNEELRGRNGYVLVAIDGNGLLFRDLWIKQGVEGGKKADAIAAHCGARADDVEIVAKVVANFGGLAKSLGRDLADVRDFALGFTQAEAAFDFVDVGYGKDCVSSKVKDTVKWHMSNHSCRHVLMGIAPDAAYASFLDDLAEQDGRRRRLSILHGSPAAADLAASSSSSSASAIATTDLGRDVFRSDRLADRAAAAWPTGAWAAGPRTASPASSPGPRGLDEPITVSVAALDSVKKRREADRLCNNHFLRGPCAKGDSCFFVHDYRPSGEELKAIAVLARQNPCASGQECDSDECIYGHHCPSIRDGLCIHPLCKFPEDAHPPGTRFKNPNIKAN